MIHIYWVSILAGLVTTQIPVNVKKESVLRATYATPMDASISYKNNDSTFSEHDFADNQLELHVTEGQHTNPTRFKKLFGDTLKKAQPVFGENMFPNKKIYEDYLLMIQKIKHLGYTDWSDSSQIVDQYQQTVDTRPEELQAKCLCDQKDPKCLCPSYLPTIVMPIIQPVLQNYSYVHKDKDKIGHFIDTFDHLDEPPVKGVKQFNSTNNQKQNQDKNKDKPAQSDSQAQNKDEQETASPTLENKNMGDIQFVDDHTYQKLIEKKIRLTEEQKQLGSSPQFAFRFKQKSDPFDDLSNELSQNLMKQIQNSQMLAMEQQSNKFTYSLSEDTIKNQDKELQNIKNDYSEKDDEFLQKEQYIQNVLHEQLKAMENRGDMYKYSPITKKNKRFHQRKKQLKKSLRNHHSLFKKIQKLDRRFQKQDNDLFKILKNQTNTIKHY